jgi:integrase
VNFAEKLNGHYDDMLKLRESLGYSVGKATQRVRKFIAYCGENYAESENVTKEMLDSYLQNTDYKTNSTHNHEITKIRGFTRYLESVGVNAFIPGEDYSVKNIRYAPYVFSDCELIRLFEAIDCLPSYHTSPKREFIIPVLFRMMYCCGMRPSEPPSLLAEDVNLKSGEVYIRQSKAYKDRRILMSANLICLCREYVSRIMPQKYFFEKTAGSRISIDWINNQFHICWRNSGLPKRGNPRPYDLRHNFATRTMMRWVNEGKDVAALSPYLSAYMGHTEFSATLYYIHLLPEHLLNSSGIDWARFSKIYPEVYDEQSQ